MAKKSPNHCRFNVQDWNEWVERCQDSKILLTDLIWACDTSTYHLTTKGEVADSGERIFKTETAMLL